MFEHVIRRSRKNSIAYPKAKPEILIEGGDNLECSVWEHELERFDGFDCESILVCLP